MANLNEYLGAIVAHLSQARVLADLESARIALTYAENDLLRHFSIPRMKIDDVELTIPVAVSELEIAAGRDPKPIDSETIAALTNAEFITSFGIRSLPAETSDSLKRDIAVQSERIAGQLTKDNVEQLLREYVLNMVEIARKKIAAFIDMGLIRDQDAQKWRDVTDKFRETLSQKLRSEINLGAVKRPLGNLRVIVESDKLKERNPNTLVLIKMKISEEAMEWERLKDDAGNTVSKLMPA